MNDKKILLYTPDKKGFMFSMPFKDAEKYREHIFNLELEERPKIIVYGKECRQNRNVAFFSDESKGYTYSGQTTTVYSLTPELKEILNTVNELFDDEFNGILVNRYDDGTNCIGAHRDSEYNLGKSGIVGLVYGADRIFRIKEYVTKVKAGDFIISDSHFYFMSPEFNKFYTHEIPVQKGVKNTRISLTFRRHKK